MKYSTFLFSLSIIFIFQSCENRLYNWRYIDRCLKCKENKSLTVEQRNEEFQFKNSRKIAYVSFPETKEMNIEKYFENLNYEPSKFNIEDFFEVKYLNEYQINELSNLIYNIGFRKNINAGRSANCYFPNNAVLFLNEDNSLLGYIEICFDCHRYRSSNVNFTLGEDCSQKIDMLKSLFSDAQITYISSLKPFK